MRWVTPTPYTEFSLCSFGKSAINEIGRAETPPETDTSLERLREEGRVRVRPANERVTRIGSIPKFLPSFRILSPMRG